MLCANMHSMPCIHSLHISHQVICDVSHATSFLFDLIAEQDTSHMHVGILQCTYVLLGLATIALGVTGVCPIAMRPFCAS